MWTSKGREQLISINSHALPHPYIKTMTKPKNYCLICTQVEIPWTKVLLTCSSPPSINTSSFWTRSRMTTKLKSVIKNSSSMTTIKMAPSSSINSNRCSRMTITVGCGCKLLVSLKRVPKMKGLLSQRIEMVTISFCFRKRQGNKLEVLLLGSRQLKGWPQKTLLKSSTLLPI